MMKLLLLLATSTATIFGVADSRSIRGNYLRQHYEDRLLKKEQDVADIIIEPIQEEEEVEPAEVLGVEQKDEDEFDIDWEQFEAEISAQIEAKREQIDWDAFVVDLVNAGLVSTPQPTVDNLETVGPSVGPTQTPATPLPSKEPTDTPTPAPTINSISTDTIITPTVAVSSMTAGGGGGSVVTPSTKPNFVFSTVTKIMLPSFRLDFVATTNMNRKLRRDELMTGDEEQTFIEMISNQIMSYLQDNLSREVVWVDLNIEDKRENHFPQMVMFSYDLGGSITFKGDEDELPPLPSSNELSAEVLRFLETDPFLEALKSFDSSGLLNIDDVVASIPSASGTVSQVQVADSTGIMSDPSGVEGSDAVGFPVVIAFVTAFAFTMAVIGFVTVRKLREYQGNIDDESSGLVKTTYQNIKEKFNSVTPRGNNRQYNQFESPESSEHSLFGGIEESDAECPIAADVERQQSSSQPLPSKYLSGEAFLAESDTTSEIGQQNLSLDLLYSDTDSYFGSSIGTSNISAGVRPTLLSKDFVYSDTDSSLRSGFERRDSGSQISELDFMKNYPYSSNTNSISKVTQLLLYSNDDAAPSDSEITEADSAAQEEGAEKSKEENPFASELSVTDDLFARLNELENRIVSLGDSKNASSEAEESAEQLGDGAFTDEKLEVLQRDRLRCTPPPSEAELDGAMIDCSKKSSLLGNVLDESDGDDDELLFEGSISTIESEVDSKC